MASTNLFLKILFFTFLSIHSFIHPYFHTGTSIRWGSTLVSCSPLRRESSWCAEPRLETRACRVLQADALISELRRILLSYDTPQGVELRPTLLSYDVPHGGWATPHPFELRRTLIWATPHPSELRRTLFIILTWNCSGAAWRPWDTWRCGPSACWAWSSSSSVWHWTKWWHYSTCLGH